MPDSGMLFHFRRWGGYLRWIPSGLMESQVEGLIVGPRCGTIKSSTGFSGVQFSEVYRLVGRRVNMCSNCWVLGR